MKIAKPFSLLRISRKQSPSVAGLHKALDLLVYENAKTKVAKPEDSVDNRYIKELDDSGYIDSRTSRSRVVRAKLATTAGRAI